MLPFHRVDMRGEFQKWLSCAMAALLEQMSNHPRDYLEGEGIVCYRERYL